MVMGHLLSKKKANTKLPGVERSNVVPALLLQVGGKMPSDAKKEM